MRTAIGIDIGGTNLRAAVVSEAGEVLAHRSCPTVRNAEALISDLDRLVRELRQPATAAIGLGIPGRVDAQNGQVYPGGYVDLSCFGVVRHFEGGFGLPAFADNDGNMALLAEARLGAARGIEHAVMLTIGTGIGGAILAGGSIFHGGGTAGQLGHISVQMDGKPCSCGRRGCLETESSGTSLKRHLAEAGLPADTRISDILNADTAATRQVLLAWIKPLRAGIDGLIACFSPELVIVGGGLGAAACEALQAVAAESPSFQSKAVPAELGDNAGVVGAGLAALEKFA